MAHRQSTGPGNTSGGTNQHMQSYTPHQLQHLHGQSQQQQQNMTQQNRHRSPMSDHHHQIYSHLQPPRQVHDHTPDAAHHIDAQLRSSPGSRVNSNHLKSHSYLQSESTSWRGGIPFSHSINVHPHPPFLPVTTEEQVRDHRDRERAEEAKRAQEQVMKHFEESFRFAQQKSSGSVPVHQQPRYQPQQQSSPQGLSKPMTGEDMKARGYTQQQMMTGANVPSPLNKGLYHHANMMYAQIGQVSPYQDLPSSAKKSIPGSPHLNEFMDIRGGGFYPSPHVSQGIRQPTRESIGNSSVEKYTNNNQNSSKPNYPTYGPPPASRVKVSSPAPPQIYGKPSITGSNSSSGRSMGHYDLDTSALQLTSKGSTRSTSTPSTSGLPKHEIHSGDFQFMYTSASNVPSYNSPQPQISPQIAPLDLGGKRKIEPKPQNVELETKKYRNDTQEYHPRVLNLVKGESEVGALVEPPINGSEVEDNKNMIVIKSELGSEKSPVEELNKREGFTTPPPSSSQLPATIKKEEIVPSNSEESETIIQPETKVNNTSGSNSNSNCPSPSIHKGKKVFMERYIDVTAGESSSTIKNGGKDTTGSATSNGIENSPTPKTPTLKRKTETLLDGVSNGHESVLKQNPSSSESDEDVKTSVKRSRGKTKAQSSKNSESEKSGSEDTESQSQSDREPVSGNSTPVKKRGRRPRATESSSQPSSGSVTPSPSKGPPNKKSNPFKRPAIHYLKKTGESFLQDGPCADMAPKLGKCRECRINLTKTKKQSNIFCRFYAFRKLRYTKNGSLAIAGFSDPTNDPSQADMNLWIPSKDTRPEALEFEMAEFVVDQLGDQFCELIHQEKQAKDVSLSTDSDFIAWKRVVQGVREMCDVCDTTLFNYHWACKKCGFVVCIACYTARKQGIKKKVEEQGKERDEFQWLFCTNRQAHEIENLMLTQAIAGEALTVLGERLHEMRGVWNIPQDCGCEEAKKQRVPNMKKPIEEPSSVVIPEAEANTQETSNTENGNKNEDPSNLSAITEPKIVPTVKKGNHDESESEADDDEGTSQLFKTLAPANSSSECCDSSEVQAPSSPAPPSKDKDENQSILKVDPLTASPTPVKKELTYFIRRKDIKIHRGKDGPPVKSYFLHKTVKEYPGVPHGWLCFGKLLHLHDPLHEGNQKLFQEVWKRGQPVIVSHVSDRLNKTLWSPESFSKDFSELKNDLVNCMTGRLLSSQPMKKFWEGFEYVNKRLKDEKGNPMLLKLKDWPPGEDFAESLPSRFKDLMANLPLGDYTNRSGRLNLASRLPDNFVKPDLGPKMYIAYGSGLHLDKGTTNLHLDISDAVNLMVHVGLPKDVSSEQECAAVQDAIEQSDVDGATIDRVKERGELPGALWHIYNARDADKIRDLLNKVAVENGVALEAHHDPIHDQSWYLDKKLRQRLVEEYNVMGYPILQFMGDAVFIPAGAPHQVRNLHNCIKIAEDFVSPENVSHCFHLTEEFRHLTDTHSNHEDKLQIKNIIYHAVKDALSVLSLTEETDQPTKN